MTVLKNKMKKVAREMARNGEIAADESTLLKWLDERTDLEASQKISSHCNLPQRQITFEDGRGASPMLSQNISQINPASNEMNLSDLVNQEIGHNTISASYHKHPEGENEELRDTFANRDMQEAFHQSNMYFT